MAEANFALLGEPEEVPLPDEDMSAGVKGPCAAGQQPAQSQTRGSGRDRQPGLATC